MRSSDGTVLCGVLLLCCAPAVWGHAGHHGGGGGPTNVVELDKDNFDDLVGSTRGAMIEFYAPWCTHCKHLQPELEKLATTFVGSEQVMVSKLNAEKYPEYSYRFGVRGFPTIFWFPAGSQKPTQEYWGERSAQALMAWINTKLEEDGPVDNTPEEVPDFDLTGPWVDDEGGVSDLTQDGVKVTAKPQNPQHWSSAHGKLKGRKIERMPFNTVVLSADVNDAADVITWSNGLAWKRVVDEPDEPETTGEATAAAAAAVAAELDADVAAAEEKAAAGDQAEEKAAAGDQAEDPKPAEPAVPDSVSGEVPDDPREAESARMLSNADKKVAALAKEVKELQGKLRAANTAKAALTAAAKPAPNNKELMACRQNALALEDKAEAAHKHATVLYCAIGVLAVLIVFLCCKNAGSADEEVDDDEWASAKSTKMRNFVSAGGSSAAGGKEFGSMA